MDIYAENNGGFQVLEGTSPFEEGSQLQGEGYTEMPYQEPAAGPAWYGETQGAEGLPAGAYQETVMQTAGGGNMYGAENFSTAPYQELPTESGAEIYMGETDVLPVAPGQMLLQETEAPVMYQTAVSSMGEGTLAQAGMPQMEGTVSDAGLETAEMQAVDPEASDQEMADSEMADLGADEMETAETAGTEPQAAEAAPDADKEDDEETRRVKHETAEAERKAEWEKKQQAKKVAEQEKLDQLANMSDDAAVSAAMKQVGAETEKLTRRNMKDCVAEYVQTLCLEDPGFARMVMHPRKNMIRCFYYINRKAKEFIQREMEDNDIKPENGVYGSDVPDDLCYQWAEEYFRDPDAEEDQEKEEKFVPKPYVGNSGSKAKAKKAAEKKPAAKKSTATKPAGKKAEKPGQEADGQMSFPGQISLSDIMAPEVKAG
ncbi:MAG: Cas9 inhibitor AcrIIA9 family protein [Lachnospiraceae bacterium]|nr:Cas9 inhibitor AcrIIA9 family protein [Lachnospiraceae bacterium]